MIDKVICGDAITVLNSIQEKSVNCCVTSPPYYGLRDYGGSGQIGLEPSPEEYINKLIEIFREVKRVLKDDGTLWLNIGDSYSRDPKNGGSGRNGKHDYIPEYGNARKILSESKGSFDGGVGRADRAPVRRGGHNCKNKDLIGIPWMVAFALRADGWYLRSDIIWHKPNCMPESVIDRPTKSHEYLFLLSKNKKYFYDAEAIKEDAKCAGANAKRKESGKIEQELDPEHFRTRPVGRTCGYPAMRSKRTVWTISTKPFKEAHFATFPEKLVEPCILAGCPLDGVVLDPFLGSGTTGSVARRLGRHYIGIDLKPEYCQMAERRIAKAEASI
jgi:DNA modification methylase